MRKLIGAMAATAALMAASTACTAADTDQPYTKGDDTWANSGDLALRGMTAVADASGSAVLVGTLLNQGDRADRLTGIAVPGGSATGAAVPLPANGVAQLGVSAATVAGEAAESGEKGADAPEAAPLIALKSPRIVPGGVVRVTFDFERAAPVDLDVLIVERSGPYEHVPAAP